MKLVTSWLYYHKSWTSIANNWVTSVVNRLYKLNNRAFWNGSRVWSFLWASFFQPFQSLLHLRFFGVVLWGKTIHKPPDPISPCATPGSNDLGVPTFYIKKCHCWHTMLVETVLDTSCWLPLDFATEVPNMNLDLPWSTNKMWRTPYCKDWAKVQASDLRKSSSIFCFSWLSLVELTSLSLMWQLVPHSNTA